MNRKSACTAITAAAIAAALLGGTAYASGPRDSTVSGDKYGYNFRVGKTDAFTDGGRTGKFDTFSDGARMVDPYTDGGRMVDPYTDGGRMVSGMDRRGVSAEPSRSFDVYTDGANT